MPYFLIVIALVCGLFIHWPMHKGYAPGGYFCVLEICFVDEWVGVSVWHKHNILMRNQDGSVMIPQVGIWSADAWLFDWQWRFWKRKP